MYLQLSRGLRQCAFRDTPRSAEQQPEALLAGVVDHRLGGQEVASLPGSNRVRRGADAADGTVGGSLPKAAGRYSGTVRAAS